MHKLLIIVYEAGIDDDMTELFEGLELEGYTKLFEAHGKGHSGKKFGDAIFPGTNNLALVALPEEQVPRLLDRLRALEAEFRKKPGIKVFSFSAEVIY